MDQQTIGCQFMHTLKHPLPHDTCRKRDALQFHSMEGNAAAKLRGHRSSHPYAESAAAVFPPPPKAPSSPSRPLAAGAASLAKKATVFPTVLGDTAPSIGAVATAVVGVTDVEPACAVEAGFSGEAAATTAVVDAAVVPSAGDSTRILCAGYALGPTPFGFAVLALGSAVVPAPLASPTVMALIILMCRFVHGRFSCEEIQGAKE